MKKINITKDQFESIKQLYLKDLLSFSQMEKKLNMSQDAMTRIIKEWGMFVPWPSDFDGAKKGQMKNEHNRRKQEKLKENISFDNHVNKSIFEEGKSYYAICKITGKKFDDYLNSSGILIRHLKNTIKGINIPTGYKKRSYEKETGTPWHGQYFDFIEKQNIFVPKKKCVYCDWTTNDLENKTGWYTTHIKEVHKLSANNHILNHPEEKIFFSTAIDKENYANRHSDKIEYQNFVECAICKEKLKYITNSHLKKHNITGWEYKIKYPKSQFASDDFRKNMTIQLEKVQSLAKRKWVSAPEQKVKDFINELKIDIESNNRKFLHGTEIDILIPSLKIGIEFNGNLYHSEVFGKKSRTHHLDKMMKMNRSGYGLIQIFEDEWEEKKEIVKEKLTQLLGKATRKKIDARKCEVIYIESNIKNNFLNSFHIQGEDRSNIHIGLVFEDKVVAVMTFDANRNMTNKKEDGTFELRRFATDAQYFVRGGAGKMLSFFIKNNNPNKIISFADKRWTLNPENNLYTKLGFKFHGSTPPEYHYFNQKLHRLRRWSKYGFGKKNIMDKYPSVYHPLKSEWDMMREAGFDRIWDCGKYKYILDLGEI